MSDLVVIAYDDPYKADEMKLALSKLQREYLLDLEDAVIVVKKMMEKSNCTNRSIYLRWEPIRGGSGGF